MPGPASSHAPAVASLPAEIFKAYDIRGIVGKTLTPAIVERIGQAIGSAARARGQNRFVIGRDGRLSGPELSAALARGLAKAGCDVTDIGMAPTPVVYFAIQHLGAGSGVAVTGSHNPPDYNGLKMVIAGETLAGEAIQGLRQRLLDNNLVTGAGRISQADERGAYLDRITGDVKLARKLRVAVDCGNGVASEIAPALLRRLGCETTELYCKTDGRFPNHHPDPSKPENLKDLIAEINQGGYDVGLAFDGDGDRLGVIAPDGSVIWPDRQMILYARDVLARHPGAEIIYDVKCSRTLDAEIRKAGGRPTMWKTGHSFIKAKLKESGALLAGEMSGHIFFKERWYGFDDGLYTAARLLELLAHDPRPTREVFAALPNTVNTPELNLKFAEGEHFAVIKELVARASFPDAKVTTIDGLRADFPDGFGLVRASNTTPVLVFRFEGDSREALERIQKRFRELVRSVRPEVALPF
ncbi:MAG: phosphoglucomutase [Candidatus Muproteobacteria bacterium RIFCSPHIGHO2_02_FULL_65_16]|uniref:Phosphoglucomutase n=1 Tax=Candidatus Muproteobacteria bacterium RIFCSPHIGHO2_02_FULL_65_16 TaxID=1817766 RepID=A0A1F6TVZ8_9PROT|nr:MAG: phosphoglucomutase [Candidatus Muproteobacteria bacterium RIFCSPHIGHO2_02_FULL_65_16]